MKTIWTKVEAPGIHSWPDAPDRSKFLRFPHRHLFRITAEVEVGDENRDVEFFDLQSDLQAFLEDLPAFYRAEGSHDSCEAMARELSGYLTEAGYNPVMVEVSEDGESGGRWYRGDAQGQLRPRG